MRLKAPRLKPPRPTSLRLKALRLAAENPTLRERKRAASKPARERPPRLGAFAGTAVLVAAAVFCLLAVLLIGLHTPPGRRVVADIIAQRLSGDGVTLTIGRLEGSPLRQFTLLDVALSDAAGPIAVGDIVRVRWRPLAALTGAVDIPAISIERIDIRRAPAAWQVAAAAAGLARSAVSEQIALARISVNRLLLPGDDPAVYKGAAKFEASSSEGSLDMRLALQRIDQPADKTSLLLRIDPRTRAVAFDVRANETQPGWLALLLGRAARPISIEGGGTGTLDNASATLVLLAGAEGRAELAGRTDRTGARRTFRLTGAAEIGQLVEARLAPLFAGVSRVTVTGAVQPDGRVQVQEGIVQLASGTLRARGEMGSGAQTVDLLFDMDAGPNAPLAERIAWLPGWERLQATGRISGQLDRLRAGVQLSGEKAGLGSLRAERLTASLDVVPRGEAAAASWSIDARALATDVASSDARLAGQLGDEASLDFAASGDPLGTVEVGKLALRSGEAWLTYRGGLSADALDGAVEGGGLRMASLAVLAGGPPSPALAGTLALSGQVKAAGGWREVRLAGLQAQVKDLATGLPWLDRLLQGSVAAAGGASWNGRTGAFGAQALSVAAGGLHLRGDGDTGADGLVSRVSLPDLSKIDPALAGGAEIDLRLAGAVSALAGDVTASIVSGSLLGRPIEQLTLKAAAKQSAGLLAGTLALTGSLAGLPGYAFGTLRQTEPGRLSLQPLEAMLGPVSAGGSLTGGMDGRLGGQMTFAAASIGELGALFALPVTGRVAGSLDLFAGEASQNAHLRATATGLSAPGLKTAAAQISLDGVWEGRKPPRGRAVASGVTIAGHRFDRMQASIEKRDTAIILSADGQGKALQASARGRLVPLPGELRIGLETMLLETGGERVALPNPTLLKLTDAGVSIDKALLRSRSGELVVDGNVGRQSDLKFAARCFPLSVVSLAYPAIALAGCATGSASLAGDIARPAGQVALRLADVGGPNGPEKLSGDVAGTFDAERLTGRATLAGARSSLTAEGTWPLGPLAGGVMDLQVTGKLDLANLGLFVPDASVGGTLQGAARLSGTRAQPKIEGRAELARGSFIDKARIVEARGVVTAEGDLLQIARTDMRLGETGRLTAEGSARLGGDAVAKLDVAVVLDDVEIAPAPAVSLRADASLAVTGSPAAPRLDGLMQVRRAVLTIPPKAPDKTAPDKAAPGWPLPFAARIAVEAPAQVVLAGRGIRAQFGGKVLVEGEAGQSRVSGTLALRDGGIDLGDARLPFDAATLTFDGPPIPVLRLSAKGRDLGGALDLEIGGTADDPQLALSAIPAAPPADVLLRLLRARGAGERAAEPGFIAGALSILDGTAAAP